jgi:hypothetical protein
MILREFYRWLGYDADTADAMADAASIRQQLYRMPPGKDLIQYKCFNHSEANRIRDLLTDDQRQRVQFTWLFDDLHA